MPWGMVVTSEAIHPKSTQMGAFFVFIVPLFSFFCKRVLADYLYDQNMLYAISSKSAEGGFQ